MEQHSHRQYIDTGANKTQVQNIRTMKTRKVRKTTTTQRQPFKLKEEVERHRCKKMRLKTKNPQN